MQCLSLKLNLRKNEIKIVIWKEKLSYYVNIQKVVQNQSVENDCMSSDSSSFCDTTCTNIVESSFTSGG